MSYAREMLGLPPAALDAAERASVVEAVAARVVSGETLSYRRRASRARNTFKLTLVWAAFGGFGLLATFAIAARHQSTHQALPIAAAGAVIGAIVEFPMGFTTTYGADVSGEGFGIVALVPDFVVWTDVVSVQLAGVKIASAGEASAVVVEPGHRLPALGPWLGVR